MSRWGPDVVAAQVGIEDFSLSPDGETIAFVRRHVEGDHYRSHLWLVAYGGGDPRRVTSGRLRDASPTFSPDGSRLAFVRTPEGADHGQVWLIDLAEGEPVQLSELAHGVAAVGWSPDGRLLRLLAPSAEDRLLIDGPPAEGRAPRVRRITRIDWRDADGHRDRRSHLFVLEPRPGAEPRQLTRGDWDASHPVWAPDSRSIAFVTDRRPERDLDPRASIWVVGIDGGEPREIATLDGDADYPAFSIDGSRLAFLGRDVADAAEWQPLHVWLLPTTGGDPALATDGLTALALPDDVLAGTWAWSELDVASSAAGPAWLDERTLVVLAAARGRCLPFAIPIDGAPPSPMIEPGRAVASSLQACAGRLVLSAAVGGRSGELYAVEQGRLRRITGAGSSWQAGAPLPRLDEVDIPGPGGPINTWLLSPAEAAEAALPLVLHFHGGPTGSFGPGGSLDAMVLTGAGYRVAMPNIRGSAGFGYAWADALRGRWGDVDAQDALAVADWLVGRGLAEEGRIGMYGLSYGGFLVQWLAGVTDRFSAAVAENGVANQVSAWANCYFAPWWNRRLGLADPLSHAGMLRLWAGSPLANVARIRTPLLMLQGEEDRVCPAADNEQLFVALRALGREVEYVLYPEERHEFKAYGRPDRRIDRHERMLAWYARHLG